jgi:hypothetical protein
MTTRVRLLLLACTGVVALVTASSAMAAFVPSIAIRHASPTLNSNGAMSIRLSVPRDDDPLFRAVIYAPPGYTAIINQAAGTQIGTVTAQVLVREPIAGAVLPLTGTITTAAPAEHAANQCAPGLHGAVWLLSLPAPSGPPLTVPLYVDQTLGTETALGSYRLTACLPSPNIPQAAGGAAFGAKLILAQLNFQQGIFSAPNNRGTFRWQLLATPWPTSAAGPPNVAGTVSAQGRVMLPVTIALRATSRRGLVTITGNVLENRTGVNRQPVRIRVGNRTFTVRTNTAGRFRLLVRRARGARLAITTTANIPARSIPCSAPSPFAGVTCVSETQQFFVAARTIRHRVR